MADGSSFLNSDLLEKYSENIKTKQYDHQPLNLKRFQTESESSVISLQEIISSSEVKLDSTD